MTLSDRLPYLFFGLLSAGAVLVVLTALLPADSIAAAVLLDRQSPIFPYPVTIQNAMTLVLGVAMGDLICLARRITRQRSALGMDLLPQDPATLLCLADLPDVRRSLDRLRLRQRGILASMIESCSLHFAQTRSTAEVLAMLETQTRVAEQASDRSFATARYMAWFLPTLGFIGTVVGIASALVLAAEAARAGDVGAALPEIVGALAVAFNTTILSLVFSAAVVLFHSWVQGRDEALIADSAAYCMDNLVRRLFVAPDER